MHRPLDFSHERDVKIEDLVRRVQAYYPDADFAGMYGHEEPTDPASVKSRTGYVITVADCPVHWQSKLQTETALSTMEAEIVVLAHSCRELFPIMDIVASIGP